MDELIRNATHAGAQRIALLLWHYLTRSALGQCIDEPAWVRAAQKAIAK